MQYKGQTEYDHKGPTPKQGVILCNLGTPDAPQTSDLRRYLKQFLSDPRVVEVPRLLWWLILNLVILRLRPRRSAKLYRSVWTEKGSPLLVNTQAQVDGVRQLLAAKHGKEVPVVLGMRYGNPSIEPRMYATLPCYRFTPNILGQPQAQPLTLSLKFSNERGGFPNYTLLAAITNQRHLLMLYVRVLAGISTSMVIRINLYFLIMAPLNDT